MKKYTSYLVISLFIVSCRSEPKLDPGRYISEVHDWCYGIEIDENSDSINCYIFPSYPTNDTIGDWSMHRSGKLLFQEGKYEVGNLESDNIDLRKITVPIRQNGDTICLSCFLLHDAFFNSHRYCVTEESKYVKIR
ncbi:MAG: hypothetical protein ACKVOK_03265 [Flavobacteriales bacterium]